MEDQQDEFGREAGLRRNLYRSLDSTTFANSTTHNSFIKVLHFRFLSEQEWFDDFFKVRVFSILRIVSSNSSHVFSIDVTRSDSERRVDDVIGQTERVDDWNGHLSSSKTILGSLCLNNVHLISSQPTRTKEEGSFLFHLPETVKLELKMKRDKGKGLKEGQI